MAENRYYLTLGEKKIPGKSGYLAIITYGSKQLGDKRVIVCSVTMVKNMKQARTWFKEQMKTRVWENETEVYQRTEVLEATDYASNQVADLLNDVIKKPTVH